LSSSRVGHTPTRVGAHPTNLSRPGHTPWSWSTGQVRGRWWRHGRSIGSAVGEGGRERGDGGSRGRADRCRSGTRHGDRRLPPVPGNPLCRPDRWRAALAATAAGAPVDPGAGRHEAGSHVPPAAVLLRAEAFGEHADQVEATLSTLGLPDAQPCLGDGADRPDVGPLHLRPTPTARPAGAGLRRGSWRPALPTSGACPTR
jgi:hypothetical protein